MLHDLTNILPINQILGRPDSEFYGWRILFAVPLLFALFQGVTLPWCPESPRFLYIKRRNEEATIRSKIHRFEILTPYKNEIEII